MYARRAASRSSVRCQQPSMRTRLLIREPRRTISTCWGLPPALSSFAWWGARAASGWRSSRKRLRILPPRTRAGPGATPYRPIRRLLSRTFIQRAVVARGQRASRLRPYRSERAPSKWLPAPKTALVGPTAAGRPVGIGPERPRPSSRYGGSTKAGVTKPSSAGLGLRGSGASTTAQPEGLTVRAMNRRSHAPSADLYLHSTVGDTDVT
jgi:hypothetical protein